MDILITPHQAPILLLAVSFYLPSEPFLILFYATMCVAR